MTPPTDATATALKEAIDTAALAFILEDVADDTIAPSEGVRRTLALLPSASVGGEREAIEAGRIVLEGRGDGTYAEAERAIRLLIASLAAPETPPTGNAPTPPALSEDLRAEVCRIETRDVHNGYDTRGNYIWEDYISKSEVLAVIDAALVRAPAPPLSEDLREALLWIADRCAMLVGDEADGWEDMVKLENRARAALSRAQEQAS